MASVLLELSEILFAFSQLDKSLRSIFVCFFIVFKDLPVINKLVSSGKWCTIAYRVATQI